MELERRVAPATLELRAEEDGDGRTFRGYAAVFDELSVPLGFDGFREQIAPGAFDKAIREDDVRLLLNHNDDIVLARRRPGDEGATLSLSTDERGLRVEADLPDTQAGRDLAVLVERRDITEMSFGFSAEVDEWDTSGETPLRTLKEVRLFDVSPVAFPAYPQTTAEVRSTFERLTGAKRASDEAERRARFLRAKHSLR